MVNQLRKPRVHRVAQRRRRRLSRSAAAARGRARGARAPRAAAAAGGARRVLRRQGARRAAGYVVRHADRGGGSGAPPALPDPGVVRVSAVHYNTVSEIDRLMDAIDPMLEGSLVGT